MIGNQTISDRLLLPVSTGRWAIAESARLQRALGILLEDTPAPVARRTRSALETILRWTLESEWSEVMWSFSRLTGDGFPIEFTFSSTDEGITYDCEVASPEVPDEQRLLSALDTLNRLGQPRPPAEIVDLLSRIQASGALSYGAWIGGRHHVDGDRYKVYAEVPGRVGSQLSMSLIIFLGRNLFSTTVAHNSGSSVTILTSVVQSSTFESRNSTR